MIEKINQLSKSQLRHLKLLDILKQEGVCPVQELARGLEVSENTVRRDLIELEARQLVQRLHGSARIIQEGTSLGFSERHTINLEEKKRIAGEALQRIPDTATASTILIDAGSTCLELLKLLVNRPNIVVLTPSLAVLQLPELLAANQVILIGGLIDARANSSYGIPAEDFLQNFEIDMLFLGITAISEKGDCYINNFNEVGLKRKMLELSKVKIGLADKSKWNKSGIALIGNISQLDEVIQ